VLKLRITDCEKDVRFSVVFFSSQSKNRISFQIKIIASSIQMNEDRTRRKELPTMNVVDIPSFLS